MAQLKDVLRKVYMALPFKQAVFTAIRAMWSPPERLYRHLYFKGVFTVPVAENASFQVWHRGSMIENELFWRGIQGWEAVSIELWLRLSRRATVIFDIGANSGIYALAAKAVNAEAIVVAVEPVGRVHERLQANIALNGWDIEAVQAAVSDHDGTAILYDIPERENVLSVSLEADWNAAAERVPVEVPCHTVATLAAKFGNGRVDLLKIDVETHEPAVLRGFKAILERDRPSMLIEILNDQVGAEVSALLDGLGYAYYNIDDKTWPPPRVERISQSGHFNFLVCLPEVASAIGI